MLVVDTCFAYKHLANKAQSYLFLSLEYYLANQLSYNKIMDEFDASLLVQSAQGANNCL